jgi:hypothetical protein
VGRAERSEQAERGDDQAGPEGPHVDEGAAPHHQRSHDDESHRRDVGGGADHAGEAVGDRAPDHASAPAHVEDRGEKRSERDEPEADQLVMLLAPDRGPLARPLPDARGYARPERPLLTALCHRGSVRRERSPSY